MKNITVKIYNSSENLIFEGSYEEYEELKKNNLVNDSDRIYFSK